MENSAPVLLDVRAITKNFGGVKALNGVSLQARNGEILGLIGPNGAGKTTLFHIIAGALTPDGGDILFADKSLKGLRADKRAAHGIARTFQIPQPFAGMTVRENIEVALLYRSARPGSEAPATGQLLDDFGLTSWTDKDSATIPLGAKKRLEFARALATGPRLLLLDEVMGGLRAAEIDDLMLIIRAIQASGVTIIMIEHVMRAVMALADQIAVLHHGELIASGPPDAITADRAVIDAYLGAAHAKA